jgi:hypothetical protein
MSFMAQLDENKRLALNQRHDLKGNVCTTQLHSHWRLKSTGVRNTQGDQSGLGKHGTETSQHAAPSFKYVIHIGGAIQALRSVRIA